MTHPAADQDGTLRGWATRHRRVLGLVGAAAAVGMTALWTFVVPDKADAGPSWRSAIIRWGHPASWAFLAATGVAVATGAPRALRELLAWGALVSYAAFLVALAL